MDGRTHCLHGVLTSDSAVLFGCADVQMYGRLLLVAQHLCTLAVVTSW